MINALIVGWDLLELGLDAKAAESITGDYAVSPWNRRWERILGSRGFESSWSAASIFLSAFSWSRRTLRGNNVLSASCCTRPSSQSDPYFHPRVSQEFYEFTRLHWCGHVNYAAKLRGEVGRREAMTFLHLKTRNTSKNKSASSGDW